ncbi:MAG: ankyrin repeat domain-containing protein [Syntrophorhabdus sp.]|nr:ankyrin repeat domain-containing protein [Syntrophorhabdus sp.]
MELNEDFLEGLSYMDRTRLHGPVETGDADRVREILEKGVLEIDGRDNCGKTPLHWACEGRKVEIVKLLLDAGADVNGDNTGNETTPLHRACRARRVDIIEVLLKAGADVNARDVLDKTPLDELAPREYLPGKYIEEKEGEVEAIIESFREYHPELDVDKYLEKYSTKRKTV